MPPIEIGKLQREFRPGMENLVAGVIIGLLLIGGGCVLGAFTIKGIIESRGQLPVWEDKGFSWGAACIFAFIVIIMIVGGALLIRWIWSLASLRVYVGARGFAVSRRDRLDIFLWDQIGGLKEIHVYERPPVLKGPAQLLLPKVLSKSYVVTRKDEKEFQFDGNSIRGHDKLAEMIGAETVDRGVAWTIVEHRA